MLTHDINNQPLQPGQLYDVRLGNDPNTDLRGRWNGHCFVDPELGYVTDIGEQLFGQEFAIPVKE